MAYTGIFPKTPEETVAKGRLALVRCDNCGLVQLADQYDPKDLYGDHYGYRSGLNSSMVDHLIDISIKIQQKVTIEPDDVVIDIGSNDATLLKCFPLATLIGIEPTKKFNKYYPNHIHRINKFFDEVDLDVKAKVITSIAVFYDLNRPLKFMQDVYDLLTDDGIWCFEQSYMPLMLKNTAYDTICHEHFEYYGVKQIKYMADRVGFKIIHLEFNDVNGGSFMVMCAKKGSRHKKVDLTKVLKQESKIGKLDFYKFAERVKKHKFDLCWFINDINNRGKKVFGYGASTKGNVILQYCGFTKKDIPYIAEVNQEKYGHSTPGTSIPIISEAEAKGLRPDYLLVFPWHFKENIIQKEDLYLQKGGKLIMPLPEINIIERKSLHAALSHSSKH